MGNCCSTSSDTVSFDRKNEEKLVWSNNQDQPFEKSAPILDLPQTSNQLKVNKIAETSRDAPKSPSQGSKSSLADVLPQIVPISFTPIDTSIMGMMNMKTNQIETIQEASRRVLYIILPYANPLGFRRRKELLLATVDSLSALADKMEEDDTCNDRIEIVVSQMVYSGQIGLSFNKNDLLFHTDIKNILWSKENLINLAVQDILSKTKEAEYFAFVDADISFDSAAMFTKTIDLLEANQRQMVQMFSHAVLKGPTGDQEYTVKSFAYQYHLKKAEGYKSVANTDEEYWHPGFAWAMHRATFRAVGGLIDRTLGSADRHMAMGLLNRAIESVPPELQETEYGRMVNDWQSNAQYAKIKLSHVDGKIYHSWHGELKNRKYVERWDILIKNNFQPRKDMKANEIGLLVWSENADPNLIKDICEYFKERNDDQDPQEALESRKRSSNESKKSKVAEASEGPLDENNAEEDDGREAPEVELDDSAVADIPVEVAASSDIPDGDKQSSTSSNEYLDGGIIPGSGERKPSISTVFKGKEPRIKPLSNDHIAPIEEEQPHTLSAVDLLTARKKQPISSSSIEQISIGSSSSSSAESHVSVHETPKGPFVLPLHRDSSSLGNSLLGMHMPSLNGAAQLVTVMEVNSDLPHAVVPHFSESSAESAQATTISTQVSSDYGTLVPEESLPAAFQSSLQPVLEGEIPGLSSFYAGGA